MFLPKYNSLNELEWYVVHLHLKNLRYNKQEVKEHPLSILNAIVKSLNRYSRFEHIYFQVNAPLNPDGFKPRDITKIRIIICNAKEEQIQKFVQSIYNYFSAPIEKTNFEPAEVIRFEKRTVQDIFKNGNLCNSNEICLEFITPTLFNEIDGKPKTYISPIGFVELLFGRLRRLFGNEILRDLNHELMGFTLISHSLTYSSAIKHVSKSSGSERNIQWVKGCLGKIYLRGVSDELMTLLLLGQELNVGTRLSNAQGQYRILLKEQNYFDVKLNKKSEWEEAFNYLLDTNDGFSNHFQLFTKQDRLTWLEQLMADCLNFTFNPTPTQAVNIKNIDNKTRRIETLQPRDQLVHLMLYRTLRDSFDKLFERESIGFRKGVSRDKAATLIEQGLKQGFTFIIRTDIESFFPNINHENLKEKLDAVIPCGDKITRQLLQAAIKLPFKGSSKVMTRDRGLCQGSPLSPLLANLYIDGFDEKVKALPVKYVRYADDFILMTKSREDALKVAYAVELMLAEEDLRLEKSKTFILNAADGFEFIGLSFMGAEMMAQKEDEVKTLKQPLYITEPFVSIWLAGQSLEIRKDKKLLIRYPIQRISEIIIMEKASFSTSLIRKCVDMDIPITSVLDSGYHVTTIKPDNKQYYETSALHSARMAALTEKEILAIAREIAGMKFRNYLPVFKQRYGKGTVLIFNRIEMAIEKINQAQTLNELRGIEGFHTKELYAELNHFIKEPGFKMLRRDRDKPDAINGLLNFGSYLLFTRINTIIRALGLNPYLGFLHSQNERYETLVADLQEIFRGRLHRFLLRIINLKLITLEDFTETPNGMYLLPEARKKFLLEFEAELNRKMNGSTLTWKEQIYMQALIVKKWVKEYQSLTFIRWEI